MQRALFNFSENNPVDVLDSEKELARWRELIGNIIALMIRLLGEDKERDILAIDASSAQFSDIPQFHLARLCHACLHGKAMERVEAVAEITNKEIYGTCLLKEKGGKLMSITHELIAVRRILVC